MARFTMMAVFVAALLCLSGTSATGGRGLKQTTLTFTPCKPYMGGVVTSTSGAQFASTFTSIVKSCLKSFCNAVTTCPNNQCAGTAFTPISPVIADVLAEAAEAIASATSTAATATVSLGFIAGDCSGATSTVSSYAKAQTMSRAIASSFATAIANVVGSQSSTYSNVAAQIVVTQGALQAACLREFTQINNGPMACYKLQTNGADTPCIGYTWPSTLEGTKALAAFNKLTADQKSKCVVTKCSFTQPSSDLSTTVTVQTAAMAEATAIVTVMTNANSQTACVFDGIARTCNQFANLCNVVCLNGLDCRDPDQTDYCSVDQGSWAVLPNGDYQCQPECELPETVNASCEIVACDDCLEGDGTSYECSWECKEPTV